MEGIIRGRRITQADLELIEGLIKNQGHRGRTYISRELCRHWQWVGSRGDLKETACRHLLLKLQEQKQVKLPARRTGSNLPRRQRLLPLQYSLSHLPAPKPLDSFPTTIEWRLANGGREALLYKELMGAHHYLGYVREIGHFFRYIAYQQERPIGCLGWAAAAWKVAARDEYIGWREEQRRKNLHRIANNTRFLVLERVPHLASHLLASNMRRLAADWQGHYGYAPVLLETFVDTTRFRGICYKAANWICVGVTKGRGKYDRHTRRAETVKAVFVYPLRKDFRQILCDE